MKGRVTLENFPEISDTYHMLKIIESLGVTVDKVGSSVTLEVDKVNFSDEEMWRVGKLRSSVLFLGSILIRTGRVVLPIPGGDKLGARPMDEFLYVLENFGVHHHQSSEHIEASLSRSLTGRRKINLTSDQFPQMGNNRTVLALMLAWANRGRTQLKNAVILPEINEVCYFLEEISEGSVTIDGIGTDTLVINSPGIDAIHSQLVRGAHLIGPDKCEYAFWIAAASLTKGDITLEYPHATREFRNTMRWLRAKLLRPAELSMEVLGYGAYRINCNHGSRTQAFNLVSTAHELYGIAFDATPLYATMLLTAAGTGSFYCFKFGYERVKWIRGLEAVGANYSIKANGTLIVTGAEKLIAQSPLTFSGDDIRGASAVLLASLATHGYPVRVLGTEHIERGMENPLGKLSTLGACIEVSECETVQ
jgi:UDP-N-acetylglucosamine 1-carboxyvinyltransferase